MSLLTFDKYFIQKIITSSNVNIAISTNIAMSSDDNTMVIGTNSPYNIDVTRGTDQSYTLSILNPAEGNYLIGTTNITTKSNCTVLGGGTPVLDNSVILGSDAGSGITSDINNVVSIGTTKNTIQQSNSICLGLDTTAGEYSVTMGGAYSINYNPGYYSVKLGNNAGELYEQNNNVSIGEYTAYGDTTNNSVFIGAYSGTQYTRPSAPTNNIVAIGFECSQDAKSQTVAIGNQAADGWNVSRNSYFQQGAIAIGDYTSSTNGIDVPTYSVAFGYLCHTPGESGRLAFGANCDPISTTATAGLSGNIPAQVAGYFIIEYNGTPYKVPLFNAA